jgi:hypothetical protein
MSARDGEPVEYGVRPIARQSAHQHAGITLHAETIDAVAGRAQGLFHLRDREKDFMLRVGIGVVFRQDRLIVENQHAGL